jgi:hypothetical protein
MQIAFASAPETDWLQIGFNVGGVILGAALAYLATRRQAALDAREEQFGRAFELFFIVMQVGNELMGYHRDLQESLREAAEKGLHSGSLALRLKPLVGLRNERAKIDGRVLSVLAPTGKFSFATDILEMVEHQSILSILLHTYEQRHSALKAMLNPQAMRGTIGSADLTLDERNQIRGPLAALDDLAQQILDSAQRGATNAQRIMGQIGPLLREALGTKRFPVAEFPKA